MSQTVSLNLTDELATRLDRFAEMLGNHTTRTKAGTILIDEALREKDFPGIEFRSTFIGRQPFVKQTGMAVWEFIMVSQEFDMDAERSATHLQYPVETVKAALNYYNAYRDEIDQALADNDIGEERMKRLCPNLRVITFARQESEQSS